MPVRSRKSSTVEVTEEKRDNRGHGSFMHKTNPCPPFGSTSSVVALFGPAEGATTEVTEETHDNGGHGSLMYKTHPWPLFASVSSLVALLMAVCSAQTPSSTDWTQFRGNARLTGVAAGALS